jgi:hypothetical protein
LHVAVIGSATAAAADDVAAFAAVAAAADDDDSFWSMMMLEIPLRQASFGQSRLKLLNIELMLLECGARHPPLR